MKLEVNINKKVGVINITSNSFVLEDLKAHICKKMKLEESDFKMKISFGDVARVELIEVIAKKPKVNLKEKVKIIKRPPSKPRGSQDYQYTEWREQQKEFLRILWSDREMSCDADIHIDTPCKIKKVLREV
jgi:hypothetical protein